MIFNKQTAHVIHGFDFWAALNFMELFLIYSGSSNLNVIALEPDLFVFIKL